VVDQYEALFVNMLRAARKNERPSLITMRMSNPIQKIKGTLAGRVENQAESSSSGTLLPIARPSFSLELTPAFPDCLTPSESAVCDKQ